MRTRSYSGIWTTVDPAQALSVWQVVSINEAGYWHICFDEACNLPCDFQTRLRISCCGQIDLVFYPNDIRENFRGQFGLEFLHLYTSFPQPTVNWLTKHERALRSGPLFALWSSHSLLTRFFWYCVPTKFATDTWSSVSNGSKAEHLEPRRIVVETERYGNWGFVQPFACIVTPR